MSVSDIPSRSDAAHLDRIRDPDLLRAELADVGRQYNTTRLHAESLADAS